jgi:hypothetical protein
MKVAIVSNGPSAAAFDPEGDWQLVFAVNRAGCLPNLRKYRGPLFLVSRDVRPWQEYLSWRAFSRPYPTTCVLMHHSWEQICLEDGECAGIMATRPLITTPTSLMKELPYSGLLALYLAGQLGIRDFVGYGFDMQGNLDCTNQPYAARSALRWKHERKLFEEICGSYHLNPSFAQPVVQEQN